MEDKEWRFRSDMLNQYINCSSCRTFQDAENRLNYLEENIKELEMLKAKNTPLNPIAPDGKHNHYGCPSCKHIVNSVQYYCECCGQKLNWE